MGGKTLPKKVLVVEDEFLVSMMITDMLTDLGHDVIGTAADLASAVRKSSSLPVDFAVLDVNLNGELSYPAADALVARGIPFLFATGYSSKGVQNRYNGVPKLQKPFDIKALERAVLDLAIK
jgi:CheY-like chemotaxis protein